MMLPTKVISALPGEPLSPVIRNFNAKNRRQRRPTLGSRTKIGPRLSSLMAIATKIANGRVTRSRTLARTRSAIRLARTPVS